MDYPDDVKPIKPWQFTDTTRKLLDLLQQIERERASKRGALTCAHDVALRIEHRAKKVPIGGAPSSGVIRLGPDSFGGEAGSPPVDRYLRDVEEWAIRHIDLQEIPCDVEDILRVAVHVAEIMREAPCDAECPEAFTLEADPGLKIIEFRDVWLFLAEWKLRQASLRGEDVSREIQTIQEMRGLLMAVTREDFPNGTSCVHWGPRKRVDALEQWTNRLRQSPLPHTSTSISAIVHPGLPDSLKRSLSSLTNPIPLVAGFSLMLRETQKSLDKYFDDAVRNAMPEAFDVAGAEPEQPNSSDSTSLERTKPAHSTGSIPARILALYTDALSDDRFQQIERIVGAKQSTVGEKLIQISRILPIPPTASAPKLAELLGVSPAAVKQTDWWKNNRAGKRAERVAQRRDSHQSRYQ